MSTPTIRELLAALPDEVAVDPEFALRLRDRVERELHSARDGAPAAGGVVEFAPATLPDTTEPDPRHGSRRFLLIAAAVALVTALGVALAVRSDSDPEPAPVVTDPPRTTFAGATVDNWSIRTDGTNTYRVAVGDSVWTMALDGRLDRRDPSTLEITGTVSIPDSSPIAVAGDTVWVADGVDGSVLRIDGTTLDTTAEISTGIAVEDDVWRSGALGMHAGERRRFARVGSIVAAGESVWLGDQDGRVLRIDPATNTVVDELDVPISADLVRVDGGQLLVVDREAGAAIVIDAATGDLVRDLGQFDRFAGADIHAGIAFVHDPTGGTVTRIDVATGEQSVSAPLGATGYIEGTPTFPPIIQVSDAGVLAVSRGAVHVLDPETLDEVTRFEDVNTNAGELTIAADGAAWIVQFYGSTLTRITPTAG